MKQTRSQDIHQDRILILDFGSQYTQLIARRVRETGVYCEIHPCDTRQQSLVDFAPRGIILSGGPESVTDASTLQAPEFLFGMEIPVLGICYGMQSMAEQLGGRVDKSGIHEFGYAQVEVTGCSALLDGIEDSVEEGHRRLNVWMSHSDAVVDVPEGFQCLASTDNTAIAAMGDDRRRFYGLQFHPEVNHTWQGLPILRRFVLDICGCAGLWTPANIIEEIIADVRGKVGSDQVLLGLSGGVDSSVVAALLTRAIGDQLICVFVDNGLLRLNEADLVMSMFDTFKMKVVAVDASEEFISNLGHTEDPEDKRKIIGNTFIDIFEREANKYPNICYLAQGTIYPDVIESAGNKGSKAHVIKSHHNVGGLPDRIKLDLIEPLRELFKDEVRRIGLELGLSREIVFRHPFPGPGLGVRILGEFRREYADMLRLADDIFIGELRKSGWYDKVSQAFAVFLPVRSVGVTGDARRYEYVIALRAVETVDFMTANWAQLPYELLDTVSTRIINEVQGISRVTYDISGKPPATIEWE